MYGITTKEALARSAPFAVLSNDELTTLAAGCPEPHLLPDGEWLFRECEPADSLWIVARGRVDVFRREPDESNPEGERLWRLEAGAVVGEEALLDRGSRESGARAAGEALVIEVPLALLQPLLPAAGSPEARVGQAIAAEIVRKLQATHQREMDQLRRQLEESRSHSAVGRLHARLLVATAIYLFVLGPLGPLARTDLSPLVVGGLALLLFAAALFGIVRGGPYRLEDHGITLERWPSVLAGALGWSVVAGGLLVGLKLLARAAIPGAAGAPILDLARAIPLGPGPVVLLVALTVLVVPAQELIAHGVVQTALEKILPGKHPGAVAVGLAAVLFSLTCLPWSAQAAAVMFPLGLFWGWLYARQRSLLGVCVSRLLLGNFALLLVGVEHLAPR
jgi:hypothetical protein